MEEVIKTFHIDWRIIIAQIVNFGLVVSVLWFFAFKPLSKMMSERTARIEKSLKNADVIEQRMQKADIEYQAMMTKAKKEADTILAQSQKLSEQERSELMGKTKMELTKIVESSRKQLALEREEMVRKARTELSEIVALATEKIIAEKMTSEKDSKLIHEALKETSKK